MFCHTYKNITLFIKKIKTYACYGLNALGVPGVINSLASIFPEEEVGNAKNILWEQCKDHLVVKSRRVASVKRTKKMAHLQGIVDTIDDLRGKNHMPRCMTMHWESQGGRHTIWQL